VLGEEALRRADVVARRPRRQRAAARRLKGMDRADRRVEANGPARRSHAMAQVDVVEVQEVALVEPADALPCRAPRQPERADGPFDVTAAAHPAALVADPAAEHEVQRRRRAARRVLQAPVEQLQRRGHEADLAVHEVVCQPRHGVGPQEADVRVENREEVALDVARASVDGLAIAAALLAHDDAACVACELARAVVAVIVDDDHPVERAHQQRVAKESLQVLAIVGGDGHGVH
jgi:hypothetical protein